MGMGWVAGLQEDKNDLGVICQAPQSPVGEEREGEGEGGKVEKEIMISVLLRLL